jgi:NADH-quinone oxidoreductase subunit J
MQSLHYILTIFLLNTAALVFISNNPVHSVLFLILNFSISAGILFLFEADFLGFLFIMVYVGAVAVLFLFVVMMLNTKKLIKKELSFFHYCAIKFVGAFLFLCIDEQIQLSFFNFSNNNVILNEFNTRILNFDTFSNTQLIGQALFNYYGIAVLIAGFILLIALIGCIILTISIRTKLDATVKQLSRKNSSHSFN